MASCPLGSCSVVVAPQCVAVNAIKEPPSNVDLIAENRSRDRLQLVRLGCYDLREGHQAVGERVVGHRHMICVVHGDVDRPVPTIAATPPAWSRVGCETQCTAGSRA